MSHYADTQKAKNAAYKSAYGEWMSTLSPEERRRLEKLGLAEPQVDPFTLGKGEDVSELPIADTAPAPAEEPEPAPARSAGEPDIERIWEVLRHLIGNLLSSPNTRLSLECLAVVSGVGFMGDSMTAIAKRHGVTRAAVSKRCIQITGQLGLPPSRAMRSLTARKAYRNAQQKHHEHRERFDDGRSPRPRVGKRPSV